MLDVATERKRLLATHIEIERPHGATGRAMLQQAGQAGCMFVNIVLLAAVCLSFGSTPFVSTAPELGGFPAGNASTCYSASVPTASALHYQFDGKIRQAPLPRGTRWHANAKHGDWMWPPDEKSRNTPLWHIRGVAYDLTDFASRHPGGFRYILNTANTDITELFEAHHIGTTAEHTLATFRHHDGKARPARARVYQGHSSRRFKRLKEAIRAQFNLNDLKEPATEHVLLYWGTLFSHFSLLGACLTVDASVGLASLTPWVLHTGLGFTTMWLGGFAHNGLHLWPRRRLEALSMYLTFSNNPFRWMQKHIVGHHVYTNTCFDGDKPVVREFQGWWQTAPHMNAIGLFFGTFFIGLQSSCCQARQALTMTALEQKLPLWLLAALLLLGLRLQGWRFVVRLGWTFMIVSAATFVLFQASHYQPQLLDGDAVHAKSDDWADFQLRTTWGWQQTGRPLACLPWLYLNLQPAHHIFPAVHHSKLRLLAPLIREHYFGLMDDHHVTDMMSSMLRILTRSKCVQP